jgi:amino acid transporter
VGASVNALINAGISGWLLTGKGPQALSVDSIASREHTVLGSAVTLAVVLAFIVATITFFTFRKKAAALGLAPKARLDRPYFFFGLRHAVGAVLSMFGLVVAVAVLWQRLVGTVTVPVPVAAALAGLVAGVAAYHASVRTSRALLGD